jgi:hypothetical protein
MFSCVCCVGSALCDGLITCSEESYRCVCVCVCVCEKERERSRNIKNEGTLARLRLLRHKKQLQPACTHILLEIDYWQDIMGRDTVVGIVTRYGLEGSGVEYQWGERFSAPSILLLAHTQVAGLSRG